MGGHTRNVKENESVLTNTCLTLNWLNVGRKQDYNITKFREVVACCFCCCLVELCVHASVLNVLPLAFSCFFTFN